MKPVFNAAEMELIRLAAQDVIVTSGDPEDVTEEIGGEQPDFG